MKQRPGFLSATGVVAAVVVFIGAGAVTHLAGPELFSPGGLNAQTSAGGPDTSRTGPVAGVASHAELDGDCGACHPAPWSGRTMADGCLDCHTRVAAELEAGNGLHGGLAGAGQTLACGPCHPEHNGPHGALTELDERAFRDAHEATGFSLKSHDETESGGSFACGDCHPDGYERFDEAVCADCHAGIDAAFMRQHEAAFGKECLPCHDGSGAVTVDHDRFPFKLTGEHAGVACDACHEGARSLQDYQRAPQGCRACHAEDDEHDGAYGRRCGDCHSARGWDDVTFDHKVFPLDHGSEKREPTCTTCHPAGTDTYSCYGCHEHTEGNMLDKHKGRSPAELQDCVRCHPGGRKAEGA